MSLAVVVPAWPAYNPAPYDDVWATTSIPMLMTNGGLDPATALVGAIQAKDHFTGANQTFLTFKDAGHCVYGQTYMDEYFSQDCATQIRDQFLKNPKSTLDSSCQSQVLPLNFEGYPDYNQYFFGNIDAWDNWSSAEGAKPAYLQSKEEIKKALRRRLPFHTPRNPFRPHI